MEKSIRFYRDGLGFKTDELSNNPEIVFFNTSGTKLELYPVKLLANDINKNNPSEIATGFGEDIMPIFLILTDTIGKWHGDLILHLIKMICWSFSNTYFYKSSSFISEQYIL